MQKSVKSKTPGHVINLQGIKLEPHVEEVFAYIYANFPHRQVDAYTILQVIVTYTQTKSTESEAFKKIAEILEKVRMPKLLEPKRFNLQPIPTNEKLAVFFRNSLGKIKQNRMWGRDLVTILLLSNDNSLLSLEKETGRNIDEIKDEWYKYLIANQSGRIVDWGEWWKMTEARQKEDPRIIFTPESGGIAPLDSDNITSRDKDHLNVEREAKAFARVAASKSIRPPLSVGIFGEWGAGKTFFMEKIKGHIDELQQTAQKVRISAYHTDIVQIRFNAWHYMESNLWASLVDHIFKEMDNWLLRKNKTHEEIDELYEKLATARSLQLQSIEELINSRKRLKDADDNLIKARIKLNNTEASRESLTLVNYWKAVTKLFKNKQIKQIKIQKAAEDLGLIELKNSAKGLQEALEAVQDQTKQGKLVFRSLLKRFKSPAGLITLGFGIIVLPFAINYGLEKLERVKLTEVSSLIISFSTILTTLATWLGIAVKMSTKSLNILNEFNTNLNIELEKKKAEEDREIDEILRYKQVYEYRKNEVVLAENHFEKVSSESEQARVDLIEHKASTRLNRFIRNKITHGDYAKHLGIIASIRKDFEELTAIMMDLEDEKEIRQEVENHRNEYFRRVDTLLADPDIQGHEDIVDKLLRIRMEVENSADNNSRFFQRIVLYIDDLDRCPPKKVIEVLQACHLLLYFPLFIVVVAVDARWVSHALMEEYKGLLSVESNGSANEEALFKKASNSASPRDYLEKIFQIPYWVRRMNSEATQSFAEDLIRVKQKVGEGETDQPEGTGEVEQEFLDEPPMAEDMEDVNKESTSNSKAQDDTITLEGKGVAKSTIKEKASNVGLDIRVQEIDPNPESLVISDYEIEFFKLLSPYAGESPRTIKRFINVYKLLRAGLPAEVLSNLVGDAGKSLIYKSIIAQLAIVTGAPTLADTYFEMLGPVEQTKPAKPSVLLTQLNSNQKVIGSKESASVLGPLKMLIKTSNSQKMIKEMRIWANLVKRYSFSARPFLY